MTWTRSEVDVACPDADVSEPFISIYRGQQAWASNPLPTFTGCSSTSAGNLKLP